MYDDEFEDDQPVTRLAANHGAQRAGKKILEDAQDYLDTMSEAEHQYLIQTLEQLAQDEPYFQVLAEQFCLEPHAKVANDALNFLYFWQLIHDEEDVQQFELLNVINSEFFQHQLFQALDDLSQTTNNNARHAVIEQALQMYKLGLYAGCVPILYAQLEGILTDVLLVHGFLAQKDTKFVDVHKIVPGLKANEIKSLWHKAKIATDMNAYFSELAAYKMDSSSNVTATRHSILHGTELNYFTQGRSFILFLWLFSTVSFMRGIR